MSLFPCHKHRVQVSLPYRSMLTMHALYTWPFICSINLLFFQNHCFSLLSIVAAFPMYLLSSTLRKTLSDTTHPRYTYSWMAANSLSKTLIEASLSTPCPITCILLRLMVSQKSLQAAAKWFISCYRSSFVEVVMAASSVKIIWCMWTEIWSLPWVMKDWKGLHPTLCRYLFLQWQDHGVLEHDFKEMWNRVGTSACPYLTPLYISNESDVGPSCTMVFLHAIME